MGLEQENVDGVRVPAVQFNLDHFFIIIVLLLGLFILINFGFLFLAVQFNLDILATCPASLQDGVQEPP